MRLFRNSRGIATQAMQTMANYRPRSENKKKGGVAFIEGGAVLNKNSLEANESPILWSPDGTNRLIGKDPDAGKE